MILEVSNQEWQDVKQRLQSGINHNEWADFLSSF
jgi:hypothetical protein